MKEYHVTGNQRIKGTFERHVCCDDSRGWFLWDKFDDLEDCYAEKFAVPNLHDCKVFELKEDGSKELVYLYID